MYSDSWAGALIRASPAKLLAMSSTAWKVFTSNIGSKRIRSRCTTRLVVYYVSKRPSTTPSGSKYATSSLDADYVMPFGIMQDCPGPCTIKFHPNKPFATNAGDETSQVGNLKKHDCFVL